MLGRRKRLPIATLVCMYAVLCTGLGHKQVGYVKVSLLQFPSPTPVATAPQSFELVHWGGRFSTNARVPSAKLSPSARRRGTTYRPASPRRPRRGLLPRPSEPPVARQSTPPNSCLHDFGDLDDNDDAILNIRMAFTDSLRLHQAY